MEKPGCPFNHFGPCLTDKCRFYLPVLAESDNCAVLAAYTNALCASTDSMIIASALNQIRIMLGLPSFPVEEHGEVYSLQALAPQLKRIAASLSVPSSVAEQAQANWAKANRILDILCEEDQNSHARDEEA